MAGGNCLDCGKGLSARNVTGRCLPCVNRLNARNPDYQARRMAGLKAKWAEPEYRAKMSAASRAHALRLARDPVVQEKRRVAGKRAVAWLFDPVIRAKTLQAVREKSGKTQSASRIAWCPPDYRELYWFLRKTKRLSLAECKVAIAAQAKADLAKLSPFERQERAIMQGARLVANDRSPSMDRPADYGEGKWETLAG